MRWHYLKGGCPICKGTRKDCRENQETGLIHCRSGASAPWGFRFIKDDNLGFGMYAEGEQNPVDSDDRQKKKAERDHKRQEWLNLLPSNQKRDLYYRSLFDRMTLADEDRADLHRRGLSDAQIIELAAKSNKIGYLTPIKSATGLYLGAQIRLRNSVEGGRYRWHKSESIPAHLQSGELPLAVHFPETINRDRIGQVGLVEGTGVKPFIAAHRLGIPVIGGAAGLWASSPKQLKLELKLIAQWWQTQSGQCGEITVVLIPDGGMLDEKHVGVINGYKKAIDKCSDFGYSTRVLWWGQVEYKQDVDEAPVEDVTKGCLLDWLEFEEILKSANPPVSETSETEKRIAEQKAAAKAVYKRLKSFTPTETVEQDYINVEIAVPGDFCAIQSGIGTGKTSLGKKKIREQYAKGIGSWVWEPLHNLGVSVTHAINNNGDGTESEIAIHLQEYKNEHKDINRVLAHPCRVVVATVDSILGCEPHYFNGKDIFLDEANAIKTAFLTRNTAIAKGRDRANELLKEMLSRARSVTLLDGNLTDETVGFFYSLAPRMRLRKIKNLLNSRRFHIELIKDFTGEVARKDIIESIQNNVIAIGTDSCNEAHTLEERLKDMEYDGYCLSSRTKDQSWAKELLKNPNKFLEKYGPRFLIYTPTAESGVDISIDGYFTMAFFLFFGVILTDGQTQMIPRVRDINCPRRVYCPTYGLPDRSGSSHVASSFESTVVNRVIEFYQHDIEATFSGCPNEDQDKRFVADMRSILDEDRRFRYESRQRVIEHYERQNLFDCLYEALVEAGHDVELVEIIEKPAKDEDHARVKKDIKRRENAAVFNAQDITADEAKEIANSSKRTPAQEKSLEKFQIKDRLPGIEKAQVWTGDFVHAIRTNQKSLLDQCEMNFLLKHPKVAQLISLKKWATRLRNKRINTQSLKSAQLKVKTAIDIGLLFFTNVTELDPDYDFYQQTDVVKTFFWKCKSPKTVRKIQTKIRTDKPMNSLRDVANIFGYTLEETRKVRVNGKPERFYKMSESLMESEYAQAILECIHRKYERILLEIEQEEADEQKPDPFDFGLQGEEAEVVRSWINSVKDTAKNDVKKLVENHPQKQLQTLDMPRSKGVALPGVSLYINNGTSATLSDQIEALYQACWNLTSWRQFEELGKRYPHEVKQLAWDRLRSTPNGKKRSKEILSYRNRVDEPVINVDNSNVADIQSVEFEDMDAPAIVPDEQITLLPRYQWGNSMSHWYVVDDLGDGKVRIFNPICANFGGVAEAIVHISELRRVS